MRRTTHDIVAKRSDQQPEELRAAEPSRPITAAEKSRIFDSLRPIRDRLSQGTDSTLIVEMDRERY